MSNGFVTLDISDPNYGLVLTYAMKAEYELNLQTN